MSVLVIAWLLSLSSGVQGFEPDVGDGMAFLGGEIATPFVEDVGMGLFTENLGQWDGHVRFVAQSTFGETVLGDDGVTYIVRGDGFGHRVKVSFESARVVRPIGLVDAGCTYNYLHGGDQSDWVIGVRSYREILYANVWPGVDVRYYFRGDTLKYDVIVGAEADPRDVRFSVDGGEGLDIDDHRLGIRLSRGLSIQDRDLVALYEDGEAEDIRFVPDGNGFGFDVEKEAGRTLVIDPLVVAVSTFIGGTYEDLAVDVEIDPEGNIYVAGTTTSMDYPVTTGAFMEQYMDSDVIVTKLDRNCTQVLWSTYIGGGLEDLVTGIELDEANEVYLLGATYSDDFPVTEGVFQTKHANKYTTDLYVLRLSADGAQLGYSTFIGGTYDETPGDIKVQDAIAYVAGSTSSMDFPTGDSNTTVAARDVFCFAIDGSGQMLWLESWGGNSVEYATSLYPAKNGDVVVGGYTASTDFPTTPGAYKTESKYIFMSFVLRYRPSTDELIFSTLLGESYVRLDKLTMDDDENVYVAGWTINITAFVNFPCTPGAFDDVRNGRADAFLAKFNQNGTSLLYATLLGSEGEETVTDIEVDRKGQLIVTGYFWDGMNYPLTPDCLDPEWSDGEGFLFVLSEDGRSAVYSTYIGGTLYDSLNAVEITDRYTLLVAGTTYSSDLEVSEGAFQEGVAGNRDIFVSELCVLSPPGAPTNVTATGGEGNITLEWGPPVDDGGYPMEKYLVLRGPTRGNLSVLTVLGNETRLVDLDVEYGLSYFYAVRAFNGRGLGPASDVVSARPLTAPDAPFNFTAEVLLTHIALRWEPPGFTGGLPITEYRLYRGTSEVTMQPLATVLASLPNYMDSSVEDNTTYVYELSTVTEFGESRTRASLTVTNTGRPTPPLGLDHTYGDQFIRLAWKDVADTRGLPVKAYNVYRRTGTDAPESIGTSVAPTKWFVDEKVELGRTYVYSVTAENAKGESEPSDEHEAMAMVKPWPPKDVSATALEHAVRVTWSPPPSDGASPLLWYRVYYGLEEGDFTCVGGVSVVGGGDVELVFLHDAAYDGVLRHYYVTVVNAEGESDPSNKVVTQLFQVLEPPRSLAIEWGTGRLGLSWMPPRFDGATAVRSYSIYRKPAGGTAFDELVTITASNLRYIDDTTVNGIEYTYYVTAWSLVGQSPPSNEARAMSIGLPMPPWDLATLGGNGSVRLAWAVPSETGGLPIQGYYVYGISEGLQVKLLEELAPETRECLLTGLVNGVVYHFTLKAFTMAGESDFSDIVEGRPVGPPSAPQGLFAFWVDDHVCVTWSTPLDTGGAPVTGYWLHREDTEPNKWVELTALEMRYDDHDVARNVTYNYTMYAFNDAGDGPEVRLGFTVPPGVEVPDEDATVDLWPWAMVVAVLLAILGAMLALGRRARTEGAPDGSAIAVAAELPTDEPAAGHAEVPIEGPAGRAGDSDGRGGD